MTTKAQQRALSGKTEAQLNQQQSDFIVRLVNLQHECMRLGLPQTSRRINEAVKLYGYEVQGKPELYQQIEDSRARRER